MIRAPSCSTKLRGCSPTSVPEIRNKSYFTSPFTIDRICHQHGCTSAPDQARLFALGERPRAGGVGSRQHRRRQCAVPRRDHRCRHREHAADAAGCRSRSAFSSRAGRQSPLQEERGVADVEHVSHARQHPHKPERRARLLPLPARVSHQRRGGHLLGRLLGLRVHHRQPEGEHQRESPARSRA